MEFISVDEFNKERDKLHGKYPSLIDDIEGLKRFLVTYPRGYDPITYRIPGLEIETEIYKVKRFRCKSLNKGSRSGIRVIYAYLEAKQEIKFVEIYYKERGDIDCNKERIRKYFI